MLIELASREVPLTRKLPRFPGRKESRWAQLLTGEPDDVQPAAEPLAVSITLSSEAEHRIATLEAEVARLGTELLSLRAALGE